MIRAFLLHLANSNPPFDRREFYALKERLLRRHGTPDGYDTQDIVKRCWGPDQDGCLGKKCWRCGGTGIYDRRITSLQRFVWCGFRFHVPVSFGIHNPLITIHGHVQHKTYGRACAEAAIWLFLLCGEFRLAWRAMTISYRYGWYAWPLLNVGRMLWKLRRFKMRKCSCGRWYFPEFWSRYSYQYYCGRCLKAVQRPCADPSQIPF